MPLRNLVMASAAHHLRHVCSRSVQKSAALAVCVLLLVGTAIGACGSKALSHAENPGACPAPHAVVDEFAGPRGAPPNPRLWNHSLTAGGTDGQLEAYTDSRRNASLDGNGNLAITAINEAFYVPGFGPMNYTSAWLDTHGHLDFCYGTVAARIKVPTGQGLRPAFWLLGSDFATAGWPQCGEIDVIESANGGGATLHGVGGYELPFFVPFDIGTGWHEYAVNWRRSKITVSMDGHDFASWTPASLPANTTWTFNDHPMYVILSMPVGGIGGPPDGSTLFPATMLVDWVRYTPTGA